MKTTNQLNVLLIRQPDKEHPIQVFQSFVLWSLDWSQLIEALLRMPTKFSLFHF